MKKGRLKSSEGMREETREAVCGTGTAEERRGGMKETERGKRRSINYGANELDCMTEMAAELLIKKERKDNAAK